MSDLTKKCEFKTVKLSSASEDSFQRLKNALTSSLVLQSPVFYREFILETDASNHGVGVVLSQNEENGQEHPVQRISRKLLAREQKYSVIDVLPSCGLSSLWMFTCMVVCFVLKPCFTVACKNERK